MGQHPRLVGGVYRVGQIISSGSVLTSCTAYNRNTNDVVGLQLIELPPALDLARLQSLLAPLDQRRLVQSPHVLPFYDWGLDGHLLYLVTDPPRGLTLRHVLDHEHIDLQRALEIARQLLKGLEALHARGLSGIDLRPQLITVHVIELRDHVLLDDIGLRSLLNALGYVSPQQSNDIGFFDPRYLAPEYMQGGAPGPWSDVYHVGLLLFELVTGRLPFVGRTPAETGLQQTSAPLPRLEQYYHHTPPLLQEVLDRALAKLPGERFASARALLTALDAVKIPPPPARVPAFGEVTILSSAEEESGQSQRSVTAEMSTLDISLQATVIERPAAAQAGEPLAQVSAESTSEEEGVYAYLCFEPPDQEPRRFPMKSRSAVVGRADPRRHLYPDIDLTPIDPRMVVSRQHARIRFEETFFYIEDLKSHNGTRLGELRLVPLKAEFLQHGDHLRFGSVECIFRVPGASDPPASRPPATGEGEQAPSS
jgi:serine/threonine protein kinase